MPSPFRISRGLLSKYVNERGTPEGVAGDMRGRGEPTVCARQERTQGANRRLIFTVSHSPSETRGSGPVPAAVVSSPPSIPSFTGLSSPSRSSGISNVLKLTGPGTIGTSMVGIGRVVSQHLMTSTYSPSCFGGNSVLNVMMRCSPGYMTS